MVIVKRDCTRTKIDQISTTAATSSSTPPPTNQQQQQHLHQQQQHQLQQGFAMNKLICSFKSDLPNEIDFAMQIATLVANTDNFIWHKDYPLVDAICSSLHVYTCVCGHQSSCYCYPRFWRKILVKNADNEYLQSATVPPDMDRSFMEFASLMNLEPNDQLKAYKRIKAVAELIKQLSMTTGLSKDEKNDIIPNNNYTYNQIKKKKLKASPSLLKFVSLLLHCDDMPLQMIGLDVLSNTASKLFKIPDVTGDPIHLKLVLMFEDYCIRSITGTDDIHIVNRSIEVVSKLLSTSSRRISSSIINSILENKIVHRIEQFLTCQYDVPLFLSALECCYRMSRHHPHLLTSDRAKYLIKILVNLLNRSQYFADSALQRIRLEDEDLSTMAHNTTTASTSASAPAPAPVSASTTTSKKSNPAANAKTTTSNETATSNPLPACQWDNCDVKFTEAKDVYTHVYTQHIVPLPEGTQFSCLWSSPNGTGPGCLTRRPKYSLLTHLSDFHCSQTALNRSTVTKPPEHPGYAPNAAILAIKRHANSQKAPINQPQSPLSTSIRLTAALILRNLVSESPQARQALEDREPLLSEICMSQGRDESKIIAECLSSLTS